MGMLLGLALLAAVALLAKKATSRHWQRRQTAVVMDTLKDLKREDVERLLKAVRRGSGSLRICWQQTCQEQAQRLEHTPLSFDTPCHPPTFGPVYT